jgi:hypothetical protein
MSAKTRYEREDKQLREEVQHTPYLIKESGKNKRKDN